MYKTKSKRGNPAWTLGYLTAKRKCDKEKQALIKAMDDFLERHICVEYHGGNSLLVLREKALRPDTTLHAPFVSVAAFLNEFNRYLEMTQRKTNKL